MLPKWEGMPTCPSSPRNAVSETSLGGSKVKWLDRASLITARDLTLGTLPDRLARAHGDRAMVEEAPGHGDDGPSLRLTFAQAAKRVGRQASAISGRIEPGDRVVLA